MNLAANLRNFLQRNPHDVNRLTPRALLDLIANCADDQACTCGRNENEVARPTDEENEYCIFEGRRMRIIDVPEHAYSLSIYTPDGIRTGETIGDLVVRAKARKAAISASHAASRRSTSVNTKPPAQ